MTPEQKYSQISDDALFDMFEALTKVAERSDNPDDWNAVAEVEAEISRRQSASGTLFV
jgi:hypothetical protein